MLVGLLVTAGFVVMEGLTQWLVRKNRRRYPWLITQADELPEFDPDRVSRFFEASFDEVVAGSASRTPPAPSRARTVR